MIFSIQSYLEDYFNSSGLSDNDRYAVSLAALYDRQRHRGNAGDFLAAMKRMRTVFYKRNSAVQRAQFEKKLLHLLDGKFKKKDCTLSPKTSSRGLKLQASF